MTEVYGKGIDSGIVFYYTNHNRCKFFDKVDIDDGYYYINYENNKFEAI